MLEDMLVSVLMLLVSETTMADGNREVWEYWGGSCLCVYMCEFCSWVTAAMKGCWAMWLPGLCCMRGCWWGLCSCWENCTGCKAARLPATLLMTGTLWAWDELRLCAMAMTPERGVMMRF